MQKASPIQQPEHVNAELAAIFHDMANCYRYLGNQHRFRAMAYEGANRTLRNLEDDVTAYAKDIDSLDQLRGIGESIAEKIIEYIETGKIDSFEKLKKKVPQELLGLMDITGFGPATVKTLHRKLHIENRDDLIDALQSGRIEKLKGFGVRRVENMRRALKLFKEAHARLLLNEATRYGDEILRKVLACPGIKQAALAGSLRRKKETIGDIDIIAAAEKKQWKKIVNTFTALPDCYRVLASGETKASILLKKNKVQVDLRLVHPYEYGSALLYFTGSKEHNVALRTWAKDRGWKLNEYGVFDATTHKRLAGNSEKEIYDLFGMPFIAPELREAKGEIEAALENALPRLVEEKDIRGDMQMHSTWSDGAEDIEQIAQFILQKYPHYEYIVITDHSPSERVAGGLKPADFRKQFTQIDQLNKKLGKSFIKKGVEVDILADGSLDLTDKMLQQFDWVIASIHNGFTKDNTERLIKACENPLVHCIGHPSGRLLGKREPYRVDWKALFARAAATNTVIEINAQPQRLDLRDDLVREAIKMGIKIGISTDAHALSQFSFMQWGVAVARRGWCSKKNILNTLSWDQIEKWKLKRK